MSRFLGFLETAPPYSIYLLVTFHLLLYAHFVIAGHICFTSMHHILLHFYWFSVTDSSSKFAILNRKTTKRYSQKMILKKSELIYKCIFCKLGSNRVFFGCCCCFCFVFLFLFFFYTNYKKFWIFKRVKFGLKVYNSTHIWPMG